MDYFCEVYHYNTGVVWICFWGFCSVIDFLYGLFTQIILGFSDRNYFLFHCTTDIFWSHHKGSNISHTFIGYDLKTYHRTFLLIFFHLHIHFSVNLDDFHFSVQWIKVVSQVIFSIWKWHLPDLVISTSAMSSSLSFFPFKSFFVLSIPSSYNFSWAPSTPLTVNTSI